jgi:hypothetical protein
VIAFFRGLTPGRAAIGLLTLAGALNVLVLLVQSKALLVAEYANADNATNLVLAKLAGAAPSGAQINTGYDHQYEAWWLLRLTVGLPDARQIWEFAPFAAAFIGFAIVVWCAFAVLGRLAAACTAVVLLSSGVTLWGILFNTDTRVGLVLHAGILCGALLIVSRQAASGTLTRVRAVVLGIGVVVLSAPAATDPLTAVTIIGAFIIAPVGYLYFSRSRAIQITAAFAVLTGALSLIASAVITNIMVSDNVITNPFPISFVAANAMFDDLQNSLAAFMSLGDGAFFGGPASGTSWPPVAAGGLCIAALFAIVVASRRVLQRIWTVPVGKQTKPAAEPSTALFVMFWFGVLLLDFLAVTLTNLGTTPTARYFLPAWIAGAALLGLLVSYTRARVFVVAGVVAFAGLAIREHVTNTPQPTSDVPSYTVASLIERYAAAHHATVGFAGYWIAAPLTFEAYFKVHVYPLEVCPTSSDFCPNAGFFISSWYAVQPHIRSFLVTSTLPEPTDVIPSPAPNLGRPISAEGIGNYTVYIYPYDITRAFGTW